VGYTGGTTPSPTYYNMGDHSETLQIEFDPRQISYAALLKVFWASHNPLSRSFSDQYKACIFTHDVQQEKLAQESKEALTEIAPFFKGRIQTEIVAAKTFYPAEDYHQKYQLQREKSLLSELLRYYPNIAALTRSTAAARVNGLLGGYGEPPTTTEQLAALGLSPAAAKAFPIKRQRSLP